jgi:alcohol dehydrogenase YqhD (iron-dependent ADH family)
MFMTYYLKTQKKLLLRHCPPNPTFEYADSLEVPSECLEIESQGGGSTIDVGKWLAKKFNLKHTAIPTTAGTGSEVTRYCVLNVDGKKKTFTDDKFIPESYILNPQLVTSLPELHTVASGLDALSQAYEAYWSVNATAESKMYSMYAMEHIPPSLAASIKDPNDERARMEMLIAANFSGRAINITKTNVCHAISYPLTDIYKVPHGIACAMSLGYFAEKFLGITHLTQFIKLLIPHYEIDKSIIADIAINSEKLKDCPREVLHQDILASLL